MTGDERDAGLGSLVRQYSENEQSLAILRSKCRSIGGLLLDLSHKLLKSPEEIRVSEEAIQSLGKLSLQDVHCNGESLKGILEDMNKAQEQKAELEKDLDRSGLSNLRSR